MNPKYHDAIVNVLELSVLNLNVNESASQAYLAIDKLLMEHHYACTIAPGELVIIAKVEFNKTDQIALEQLKWMTPDSHWLKYPLIEGEIVFAIEPHYEEERFAEPYIEIVDIKYYRYFDDIVNPEDRYGIWKRVPYTLDQSLGLSCEDQMIKAAIEELGEMDREIYDEPLEKN